MRENDQPPPECSYEVDDVLILHVYDAPHLIKGIRNNFLKKDIKGDFLLGERKQFIAKWDHIVKAYETDAKINTDFKLLHKLTDSHLYEKENQRVKMKVRHAVQVLSHSVAVGN